MIASRTGSKEVEPEREPHPGLTAVHGQLVGGAGAVGAHQDLPFERLRVELLEREVEHQRVIARGVRTGVPGPQDPGGRLPCRIQVAQQRMMTVAALEVPLRPILLRISSGQRRVEVEHRQLATVAPCPALRARTELPCPRSRERDRRAQPREALFLDRVDHPQRGRVRRDIAEQVGLVALSPQVSQALPAVGEHHRQIAQHHPRVVRRAPLAGRRHRPGQRPRQPHPVRDTRQQRTPSMPDLSRTVRPDD